MSAAREAALAPGLTAPEALFTKLRPGPGREAAQVADHQRARIRRAMIEAVAERGYDAVTVRELAGLAGVSTRALYQHYSSKQECLLHAHKLIVRRWLRRLDESRAGGGDGESGVGLAIAALVDEWSRDPRATRFALVEAHASGPLVLEQAQQADRAVEARIATSFDPIGEQMTPLLSEAVAGGVAAAARSRLLSDRGDHLSGLGAPLTRWALSYPSPAVSRLPELDRATEPRPSESSESVRGMPSGDIDLLLTAVGKLSAAGGLDGLTVRKVLAAAGIPRRAFYANFSGIEDCVCKAFEGQAVRAIERMERAAAKGATPSGGVYQAVRALCTQIASDPVFARLCFSGEIAGLGAPGMECRERFMAGVQGIVSNASASGSRSEQVAGEASVGAAWRVLERKVAAGQARQAPGIAASLTYLLLAPIVGTPLAIEAIDDEQVRAARI